MNFAQISAQKNSSNVAVNQSTFTKSAKMVVLLGQKYGNS
jgi:hypothetical protein